MGIRKRGNRNPTRRCTHCGRRIDESRSHMCRSCVAELRELLIGSPETNEHPGQPGIIWYVQRLYETAYRQAKVDRSVTVKLSQRDYALLADTRAVKLVHKIHATLDDWADMVDRLLDLGIDEGDDGTGILTMKGDLLYSWHARYIAAHAELLCAKRIDAVSLLTALMDFARKAWHIINRRDDVCCGACPAMIDVDDRREKCSMVLYANDEQAKEVRCTKCGTQHEVAELRAELERASREILFSAPELLRLMETRLNDRMPKSTFYRMIADGRLRPRTTRLDGGMTTPVYTYADVCEAREKPTPKRRLRRITAQ